MQNSAKSGITVSIWQRCSRATGYAPPSQPAEIAEFLHALALHLGAVDIALAVDADEVEVVELAELVADAAERPHQPPVGAVDHVELAVGIVDHQEIGLRRIRPLGD